MKILILLLLVSCGPTCRYVVKDKAKHESLFIKCLEAQKINQSVEYNDNEEVIVACRQQSEYILEERICE